MKFEDYWAIQFPIVNNSTYYFILPNYPTMSGGKEIISEVGLSSVAAGDVIVNHNADRAPPIQVLLNLLLHGNLKRFAVRSKRREGTEEHPPWDCGILFGSVIKDRFFRRGHQQVDVAEPSSLQGTRHLCRVKKRLNDGLNEMCHNLFILSEPFQ